VLKIAAVVTEVGEEIFIVRLCCVCIFQLVVGYLGTSQLTGRLQLSDQTGSIDCVVAAWPLATGESLETDHCSGSSNCVSSRQSGRCPFIQTSLLGGVFRVDRFRLVAECFRAADSGTAVVYPYIQFAAADLLELCRQPGPKSFPPLRSESMSNQLPDSENTERRERLSNGNYNCLTRTVVTQQVDRQNDSCIDMFLSFVGSPVSQTPMETDASPVVECRCFISQLFLVDSCENISLRSQYIEQLSLQFTAMGWFVGAPELSNCGCGKSPGNSMPPRLPAMRPVAILFSSRSVRWHPVLHVGCIYRLTRCSSDVSLFLGKFVLPRTKKTKLERHTARSFIAIDTDLQVEQVDISSANYGDFMSPEEAAELSTAVDEVRGRLKQSDEFWEQQCHTSGAR